ncbi:hypothetical protein K9L63_01870 [Candidatus Gracilibacteria bacterium]|nr:hypothetical protein [Candidatus Gracilibacteria bacterium]
MKFILNTAVDPHFCALFDENGNLIERCEWTNRRRDGQEVFCFLQKHTIGDAVPLTFLGGVAGPGGFSSLRAGAGILNALSFAFLLPVYQVQADKWIQAFLGSNNFVLNSFSDGVFFPVTETAPSRLQRITVDEAVKKFTKKKLWVELLPEEKKEKFKNQRPKPFEHSEQALLRVLEASEPRKEFMPDYEFPPV